MFGIYTKITKYGKKFAEFCEYEYVKNQRKNQYFVFNKQKYNYFIHPYNCTWKNERTVEIPLIKKILDENKNKEVLEVGNVMSHYSLTSHDILDKYETADNVINKDVVNFKSQKKYDLIISVSTLEHVGWDEKVKDFKKILRSISNLKKILNKNGKIIFTHPLGYNIHMDRFITNEKIKLDEVYLMLRISKDNKWRQFPWKKQLIQYNYPFDYANGVVIGTIKK